MFLSFSIRLSSKKSILFCPFLDQNDSLGEMLSLTVLFLPQFMLTRQKTNLVNFDRTNLAVFFFKLAASLLLEMEEKNWQFKFKFFNAEMSKYDFYFHNKINFQKCQSVILCNSLISSWTKLSTSITTLIWN